MSFEILVDGYNLINSSPSLKKIFSADSEEGRKYILSLCSMYRKVKEHTIRVIFDAYNSYSFIPSKFHGSGVSVVFTAHGETADDYIKNIISNRKGNYIVVTSDNEIINFAARYNVISIKSEEFLEKLEFALYSNSKGIKDSESFSDRDRRDKRGNPKKLPKKLRVKNSKLEKL